MSELKVNKVSPRSGTSFTLGDSGDTFTVPSGATLTTTDATVNLPATQTVTTELKTNKISPASGTAFTFGDSGDTFTIPSGATIANSGTATGFGDQNPTHISRTVNSSDVSSISVQSCFSASYDVYKVVFYISTTQANGDVYLRFLKNTSDVFTGNNLDGNLIGAYGTTSPTSFTGGGISSSLYARLSNYDIYSGFASGLLGVLYIANAFNRSDGRMHIKWNAIGDGAVGVLNYDGAFVYSGSEIATGFQIYSGSGSTRFNFSEINVYGYNQ